MKANDITVHAPRADWLAKLTAFPLGRSRWQKRFFVLLNSELRYYKDEHSDTPLHVLNLNHIADAIPVSLNGHAYSIRLEPICTTVKRDTKPWTFACSSEADRQAWLEAIQSRLRNRILPPGYYHAITYEPRPCSKKSGPAASLSRRRGIVLPPIIVANTTTATTRATPAQESPSLTPCFSCSDISSVAGQQQYQPHLLLTPPDTCFQEDRSRVPHIDNKPSSSPEASPTFLMYRGRFHLY